MAARQPSPLIFSSLSGGVNDFDPPTKVPPDQCVSAVNVEFWGAPLGARRLGCTPISLAGSAVAAATELLFIHRHLPSTDPTTAQLWVAGIVGGVITFAYKDATWHTTTPVDAVVNDPTTNYQIAAQTLHGKLFIAYQSAVNRLHVWDGTSLRRTGLAESAAPTGANTGSGTFSGTRYYRVRYTVQSAGTTLRRSEPSDALTFSPSGSGSAARITKPASISESETHWELEASVDNANFYRIATIAVGTTTYDDSTSISTGYAANPLSDDIGDYSLIPSVKYLKADQDRLLVGGSFESGAYSGGSAAASTVSWTPVYNDPGVGNDERIPIDTDNSITLDGFEGGGLTGFGGPINGVVYGFKQSHVYRLMRTGQRESAYDAVVLTKERGALSGSIIEAIDEAGRPALYFLDPYTGACRVGISGLLWAGHDIYNTWKTVNINAGIVQARSVFYRDKQQIHWFVPTGAANSPTCRLTLQTNETTTQVDGVRKGWSTHTGYSTGAMGVCLFSDNIDAGTPRNFTLKPFIVVGATVQLLDSGMTDAGNAYTASLTSSPRMISGTPLAKSGVRTGILVGSATANAVVSVGLNRNFGVETTAVDVSMAAAASENPVIKPIDNLALSELQTIQLTLADGAGNAGTWNIHRLDLLPRAEEIM